MNLIEKIKDQLSLIEDYKLKRFLLTVSGGIDSTFLLYAFKQLGVQFEAAHVNYKLRGKDSDLDESFVKKICADNKIKLYLKHFETDKLLKDSKLSLQMLARSLRYEWFNELLDSNGLDYIITAHHLDDQIETFILNLSRGTGLGGLVGIKTFNDRVFRPLLKISRKEIELWVNENKIDYRIDKSNYDNKYNRNLIRNKIVPLFKEINPSFEKTMLNNFTNLSEVNNWTNQQLESEIEACFLDKKTDYEIIRIKSLLASFNPKLLLYQYLSRLGFNGSQVDSILKCLYEKKIGKIFKSKTHLLGVDREQIIISRARNEQNNSFEIKNFEKSVTYPVGLSFEILPKDGTKVERNSQKAFLDYDKIELPIKLRKWVAGDCFQPLGMAGKKKISDFLVDSKVPLVLKQQVYVLTSGDEIIWIIGYRISDKFKISSNTRQVLLITKKPI